MPRPLFDHFRFIAARYDRMAGDSRTDQALLTDLLDLPTSGWLLDLGGGTGRVAQTLRPRVGGVIVADASRAMLRQARAKRTALHPTNVYAEHLPFAAEQFARILVVDAFHHFHDHAQAVRELWRVLAPGGRLLVMEPNIERTLVKIVALGEHLLMMRSRFFPPDTLRQMFELYGANVSLHGDNPLEIRLVAHKPG